MGIIGMKVYFRGFAAKLPWDSSMEPFLHYALSQPITTVVIGCDSVQQLEENVVFAESFHRMSDQDKQELEGRIEPLAGPHVLQALEVIVPCKKNEDPGRFQVQAGIPPLLRLRGVTSRVPRESISSVGLSARNAELPVIRTPDSDPGARKWRAGTPAATKS